MTPFFQFIQRFQKYLKNTSWIFGEKIASMAISFTVAILVARHFGPELFGVWSYALSLVGLFAIAGHMGLSGLAVRELVGDPDNVHTTLGTVFSLKFAGMCAGITLLIVYNLTFETLSSVEFWVPLIVGVSLIFRAFAVIQFWFESQTQARYTSIACLMTMVVAAGYKIALIVNDSSLVLFASSSVLEAALLGTLLMAVYQKTTGVSPLRWRFCSHRAKKLLKKGGLIFLGSFFAMVYLKIDQVMLRWLVTSSEVGVYAVAARLSEIWYFIPAAIVGSFFPRLISLRKQDQRHFDKRLQQVFDLLFTVALVVAICVSLVSESVIHFLFGESYAESAIILKIHIWAGLFIFMRAALSKWIIIEDVLVFSIVTQGFGAVVNIVLNMLFIPYGGGAGAAWATLLSYAVASYFSLLFVARTRPIFIMMSKAIITPVRYGYYVRKRLSGTGSYRRN